jgi:hypothetical protein
VNARIKFSLIIFLISLMVLSACNFPRPTPTSTADAVAAARTAAAKTVVALMTSGPGTPAPTQVNPTSPATTQQPVASSTPVPPTQLPANTPIPSATPTATTPPTPCDLATLVSETIPDGESFTPGQSFIKTWTLKNIGTCTWNSSYSLVFTKGEAMSGPAESQLTSGTVAPGQSIQVSVNLKAPVSAGTFRGEWMLRNASNVLFGLGYGSSGPFWVEIKVTGTTYSFINNMCTAEWRSGGSSSPLPCPGNTSDANGFVINVNTPILEGGSEENEAAVWTNPQPVSSGYITGKFPSIIITRGNHFKTVIGCLNNTPTCNVRFTLSYRADGGDETVLKTWDEKYDGKITKVDLDLSSLAGKSVSFILTVKANDPNNYTQNQAFWLLPRIE